MKKVKPGQLDKYDINQKIIRTLADLEARIILFSIRTKAKGAEDIARDQDSSKHSLQKTGKTRRTCIDRS